MRDLCARLPGFYKSLAHRICGKIEGFKIKAIFSKEVESQASFVISNVLVKKAQYGWTCDADRADL